MLVAIHKKENEELHSTNWVNSWIESCISLNISYEVIDVYKLKSIEETSKYDLILWYFDNYNHRDMTFSRSILKSIEYCDVKTFPDDKTIWFYDDKISQYYLFDAIGAPIPRSWVHYDKKSALSWAKGLITFPVVAKLKVGSGSNNVKLLKNKSELRKYIRKMFSSGYKNVPSLVFKTISNFKSSVSFEMFKKRFKRIPEFLRTRARAKKLPREFGYVYFQEFIDNDGFDLKVIVVNDKLSFFGREIRKGDFRASGGGNIIYDEHFMNQEVIDTAFEVSDRLGLKCVGFDFVIDRDTGKSKIIEMSYNFAHELVKKCGFYYDRKGNRFEEALDVPLEVLKTYIKHPIE
jgi:glutathione synthase/RimK-type ligase-like ATP-grasp enzyme